MNLSSPDSFPLPPACKRAVPFFEESDLLREHATCWDDLTAAFYLRWAGLKVCIDIIPTLNPNESGYVNVIMDRLLQQIQEMKASYQTNEADGLRVLRLKCQSIYYACIEYGANESAIIPMEYAYYFSLVVTYLQAIEKVGSLTDYEKSLLVYCMYMVTTLMNKGVHSNNQTLDQRLGLPEKSDVGAAQVADVQQVPLNVSQPNALPVVVSLPAENTEMDLVNESPNPDPIVSPSSPSENVEVPSAGIPVMFGNPALTASGNPALTASGNHFDPTMSGNHFDSTPNSQFDPTAPINHSDPTAAMLDATTRMLRQSQAMMNMMSVPSVDQPSPVPLTPSDSFHSSQPTLSPSTSIPAQPSEPPSLSTSMLPPTVPVYPPSVPNAAASPAPEPSSLPPSSPAPMYPPPVSASPASIYPPSLPKPLAMPPPPMYPPSDDPAQPHETTSQPSFARSVNASLDRSTETDLPVPTDTFLCYSKMSKEEQVLHLGKALNEVKELVDTLPDDTLKMELQRRLSLCYYLSSALYR